MKIKTAVNAHRDLTQLLTFLQHGDSQFPTGAFAFSSGLEGLLSDHITSPREIPHTVERMIRNRWATFDRVAVRRAWRAHGDLTLLSCLDRELDALLLPPAERTGSQRAGAALLITHIRLGTALSTQLHKAVKSKKLLGHRTILEGALWWSLGLTEIEAALLSGYGLLHSVTTAAVKLGHLGALRQQQVVSSLTSVIAEFADAPLPDPPVLRMFNPLAEIAIMRHTKRDRTLFST